MSYSNILDITSMQRALKSLESAMRVFHALKDIGQDEKSVIRAGVIQNFEFTYELSWKYMKRWIEMNVDPIAVDGVTRRELFRQAAENMLITDVEKWMEIHQSRNRTSHIYDENVADEVLEATFAALPYFKCFVKSLEARL